METEDSGIFINDPLCQPKNQGWQVKIRNREIRESPHVTIFRRGKPWRWKLREQEFMDKTPNPSDVREELIEEILNNYELLCNEWDKMYPGNPIWGDYDDEGS